jgi:DNA-binding response OmpR family regulator
MGTAKHLKRETGSAGPGRFTRVSVQTRAGEIEARLSERGNWELRVRRDAEATWQLACSGDLDSGAETAEPALARPEATKVGPLEVDAASRQARVNGVEVRLTKREFSLLLVLCSQPGRVFTKQELFKAIWGGPYVISTRTLESHASRVRTKLKAAGAGSMVLNCWGVGYRLLDGVDPDDPRL